MWDLPGPGLEPVSPALAGGFLTTVPPGKPKNHHFRCARRATSGKPPLLSFEGLLETPAPTWTHVLTQRAHAGSGTTPPAVAQPDSCPTPAPSPALGGHSVPRLRSCAAIRVRPQPAALGPHWVAALGSEGGGGRWSRGTRGEAASVHGGFRLQDAPGLSSLVRISLYAGCICFSP